MNTSAMQYGKNIELKSSIMPSVASEAAQFLSIQPAKKSKFIALSVGRFVALKGFDLTIKSFATFYHGLSAEEKEHAELVLIGKGPQEAKMRDWIAEENIEECTTIIPWVERAELIGYYEKASVLLFPSHEGAGMVVSEALAHGLPVVCLDNDGPGEFVTPQCGMATPIGNYDDMLMGLGASLYKLFRDKTLYGLLSKGAVRRHEKAFHWNRRGEHIAEVYDKVMSSAEAQSERDFAPILSPCI